MKTLVLSKPKSFVMYADMLGCFEALSPEECKDLIIGIFKYHIYGQFTSSNRIVQIAFEQMRPHFDRNAAKYQATCERKREWAEKQHLKHKTKASKNEQNNNPANNESLSNEPW